MNRPARTIPSQVFVCTKFNLSPNKVHNLAWKMKFFSMESERVISSITQFYLKNHLKQRHTAIVP